MSDDPRPTDVDLSHVYDAAVADPDGDHAPGGTLAPVVDALLGPSGAVEGANRLERYLPLATSVADVQTGPGRLLERADSFPTVVGTESRRGFLARAAPRGPVVRASPTDLPIAGVDAVSAFGFAVARLDGESFPAFVRSAHAALSPGGTLLFDALCSPSGVDDRTRTVSDGTVQVRRERTVESCDAGAKAHDTYVFEDLALEKRTTIERTATLRTFDPGHLWDRVTDAGFADVMVTSREADEGAVLVVADREGDLSPGVLD